MFHVVLALVGLIFGSFVNALVWRVHEQSKSKRVKLIKRNKDELSILHGRSMCPNCKHTLSATDLIPVFSWLMLRGKCRYCRKPIGWQYPMVEIITAVMFVFSYVFWPLDWRGSGLVSFAVWLPILTGYIALAVYDLKWMLLPNRIVYPLLMFALIGALAGIILAEDSLGRLFGVALSVAVSGGIFYLIFIVSTGRWIGGGDVKLGALVGLTLSTPQEAFLVLLMSSVLGTLLVLPGLILKKISATSKIPFGPFLIAAGIIIKLFGKDILDWYMNNLLPPV